VLKAIGFSLQEHGYKSANRMSHSARLFQFEHSNTQTLEQMKKIIKASLIGLTIGFILFIITNPSEDDFLTRLGNDYGNMHHGTKVSNEMLKHMGKSKRTTYLLWSTFHYEFGNATADYYGVANIIFFKRSTYEPFENKEKHISI